MALNLLAFPAFTGLLSGRAPVPQLADAGDEAFLRLANPDQNRASMGYYQGADVALNNSAQVQPALNQQVVSPQAAPQRERVSPWRVLDRVLGGETITSGLDSERARLQAEAMRPQQLANEQRIQALVSQMPPQAQIAYALNPLAFGGQLAEQFAPQVIAAGGVQSIAGTGQRVGAPNVREFGDRIATTDPLTQQTTYSDPRAPTFQEQTARLSASTANVAQDGRLVDTQTGRVIAEGIQRPDIANVAPGGTALAFGPDGQVINSVVSTQQRPASAAQLKRADDLELQITQDQNAISRVGGLLQRIESGDIDISPMANVSANVRNAIGASNQNSLGIAEVRTTVEALRNSILQDANGVQTEGDAVRALNAILAGINDPRVVAQGFREFLRAKQNLTSTRQQQLERLQGDQGQNAPPQSSGPIAQDASGNRVQWNGSAWVPL